MPKTIYGYTKDTRVTAVVLDGQAVDPPITYDDEIRTDTPAAGGGLVKQPIPVMGNKTRTSKMPKLEGIGVMRKQPIPNLPVSLDVVVGAANIQYTERPFSKNAIVVTVTYMDGTTAELDDADYTVSPSVMPAEAGACDVVFSYTEKGATVTATEEVTVTQDAPASIAVTGEITNPQILGAAPDITGLVVTATLTSGATKDVTADVAVTPATYAELGEQSITITYSGLTATVGVNVVESGT